jgi:cell division protein FtsL
MHSANAHRSVRKLLHLYEEIYRHIWFLSPEAEQTFQRLEYQAFFYGHLFLLACCFFCSVLIMMFATPGLFEAAYYWPVLVGSPFPLRIRYRDEPAKFSIPAMLISILSCFSLWPVALRSGLHREGASVYSLVCLLCAIGVYVIVPHLPSWRYRAAACILCLVQPMSLLLISGLQTTMTLIILAPLALGLICSFVGFYSLQYLRRKHFVERERLVSEKDRLLYDWKLAHAQAPRSHRLCALPSSRCPSQTSPNLTEPPFCRAFCRRLRLSGCARRPRRARRSPWPTRMAPAQSSRIS